MYLLLFSVWVFMGLSVGWLAGKSLEGEGYGASMDISMGIAGAIIGGVLMRVIGFSGIWGNALATLVAVICAALLTTLTALSNGRKLHVRTL